MNRRKNMWFYEKYRGLVLSVLAVVGVVVVPGLIANRDVNRNKPPAELHLSALRVIESIHTQLSDIEDVQTLYSMLDQGVSIYYLLGPEHPACPFEYRAGLYMARWHGDVYPLRVSAHHCHS